MQVEVHDAMSELISTRRKVSDLEEQLQALRAERAWKMQGGGPGLAGRVGDLNLMIEEIESGFDGVRRAISSLNRLSELLNGGGR